MLTSGRLFCTVSIVLFFVISSLMFSNAPRKDHLSLSKRDYILRRQGDGSSPSGSGLPNSTASVNQQTGSFTSTSTTDASFSGTSSFDSVRETTVSTFVSTSTVTSTISTTSSSGSFSPTFSSQSSSSSTSSTSTSSTSTSSSPPITTSSSTSSSLPFETPTTTTTLSSSSSSTLSLSSVTTAVSSDVVRATTEINAATSSTTFTIDFATSTASSSSTPSSATETAIIAAATSDGFWANKSAVAGTFAVVGVIICAVIAAAIFFLIKRRQRRDYGSDYFPPEKWTPPMSEPGLKSPSPGPSIVELSHPPMDVFSNREVFSDNHAEVGNYYNSQSSHDGHYYGAETSMTRGPFYGIDGTQNYPLGSAPDIILTYAKDVDRQYPVYEDDHRRASTSSSPPRPSTNSGRPSPTPGRTSLNSGRPSPTLGRRSPTSGRPAPSSLAQHAYSTSNTSTTSIKPVAGLTVPPSRKDPSDRDSEVSSIDSFYGASASSAGLAI
ncbi:uncharacterized protein BT62DRAFT_1073542 [Guyanagaster necrorhizus]|uniref:Uncharacterized protein n=1 Tax=Guyanagaster necrorhizus TaxID=856835 RepID=A0A9P7VYC7_9AGAR|nr:uncharacterized protein BT62DRAFT_1073542 [Guyanagaster necrorhizus MCA 3950]KAG7449005.1 hypothetical protein BT62DRAFT_1073542 [Guyanagaster necrorhizus MCA 3950]